MAMDGMIGPNVVRLPPGANPSFLESGPLARRRKFAANKYRDGSLRWPDLRNCDTNRAEQFDERAD